MLLRCYPFNPSKWEAAAATNLQNYRKFLEEFILSRNRACGKEDCALVPSPLKRNTIRNPSDSSISADGWSAAFGCKEIREIIWKDVERTCSEISFFALYNRNVLARILFVLSQLNKGVEYVQGMNELLAPLLLAFARGEERKKEVSAPVTQAVEADTFFAFMALLSETRDLFVKQIDDGASGLWGCARRFTVERVAWRSWTRFCSDTCRR